MAELRLEMHEMHRIDLLRRLEQQELVKSSWETKHTAFADQRPARKYYRLMRDGKDLRIT